MNGKAWCMHLHADASKFSYRTIYILLNSQSAPWKEKIIHNKNVI